MILTLKNIYSEVLCKLKKNNRNTKVKKLTREFYQKYSEQVIKKAIEIALKVT